MSDKLFSNPWIQNNVSKFADYYSDYHNNELNFIRQSIGMRYRPSHSKWEVNLTKDEFYAELILHIELMKDKFPESNGRLCRICENPWTYKRSRPNEENVATGTDGAKSPRIVYPKNFSIDRFDPLKGYVKGNIIFCCRKCNRTKSDSTKKDWLRYLEIDKEMNETK